METKKIEIKVKDCKTKSLDSFQEFQGELKKISPENLKRLKQSIVGGGFTAPLFIWQDKILDGHQRKIALESLRFDGYEIPEIPYVEIEATDEVEAKKILLTYISQYADINRTGLEEFMQSVGLSAADLSQFAVLPFIEDMTANEITNDDVDLDVKLEPVAKTGQIYQLGQHRLMCGDSTSHDDCKKLMGEDIAQMVFTDPPYNVDYTGGMGTHDKNSREGIMNDKMSNVEFYRFLFDACKNLITFSKGGIYICMSSSEIDTLKKAFQDAGGHWQSFIIWVKNTFTLSRADYQHTYEPILYGWPDRIKNHYFINQRDTPNVWEDVRKVKTEFDGSHTTIKFHGFEVKLKGRVEGQLKHKKQITDIWRYDKPTRSAEHPTMKPLELCAEAIKNSTLKGEIVLDLFGGSGSTLIAADKLQRVCYMMEMDPRFVDVIIDRWEKHTGLKAKMV